MSADPAEPINVCCDVACMRDEIRPLGEAVRALAADIRAYREFMERSRHPNDHKK